MSNQNTIEDFTEEIDEGKNFVRQLQFLSIY